MDQRNGPWRWVGGQSHGVTEKGGVLAPILRERSPANTYSKGIIQFIL